MISTYEIGLILSVGADEKGLIAGAKKFIEKQGVKIDKEDIWGKKTLAYGIKKQNEGIYAFFTVDTDGATISKVTSSLKTHEPILRYLILKADGKKMKKNATIENVPIKLKEVKQEEPKKVVIKNKAKSRK